MMFFKRYLQVAPLSLALWRSLEAKAVSKIKLKRPILDIGCGFGEFAGVFFNQYVEVGIDINGADLVLAAKNRKYKQLVLADARDLPFPDKTFHTVISISSLEHIKNPQEALLEAHRILKEKGIIVFTVPTRALNELLIFPFPKKLWLKVYHFLFKHEVIVDKDRWIAMTEKAGFRILSCQSILSKKQVSVFQLFLLSALPSQVCRWLFKNRLVIAREWKVRFLSKWLRDLIQDRDDSYANIIIVGEKVGEKDDR